MMPPTFVWTDNSLKWNPSDYSGIDRVELAVLELWTPTVILANKASGDGPLQTSMPVTLTYDGRLFWQNAMTVSVLCKTDLRKYPFDSQICPVVLFSSGVGYKITLEPEITIGGADLNLQTNGEWETVNITSAKATFVHEATYHLATFYIHLSRKYLFHVLNLVYPMCLQSALNSFVFLLPASSGEKMGFVMTVFVSNALFLSVIHNSTSSTSDSVSNLSMHLIMVQIQGFLAIAATILVQNVHHRRQNVQDNEDPQGWRQVKVTPQDDTDRVPSGQGTRDADTVTTRKVPLDRMLDCIFFVCFTCFGIGSLLTLLYA
ncbi:neuronal acetylcholine receptor subunit alpha-3-like [Haliotis rubra]|uniref:neuronal acetylcholine receptor subunit alpha-3-like n=1 Tax=Haliotis rubra TaxID=36100 RepID=UPI001EE5FAF5|nr:neuronal acetylcholine receptor subunit alpha-3-like [Haliotis rubra]